MFTLNFGQTGLSKQWQPIEMLTSDHSVIFSVSIQTDRKCSLLHLISTLKPIRLLQAKVNR